MDTIVLLCQFSGFLLLASSRKTEDRVNLRHRDHSSPGANEVTSNTLAMRKIIETHRYTQGRAKDKRAILKI
ncbi:MAG: hypothetical protein M1533_06280 [Candidatus Thermoplasmatota archaeon]|nr:hypothetical protein [Candidatus Thermoplasmatota archaeon]